jgi:hypothetical protein
MISPPSSNPRLTFAIYKLQDVLEEQQVDPHPDYPEIVPWKHRVLRRFQPVFDPAHIPQMTEADFCSFLRFRNNHHWDSLCRVEDHMVEDMDALRSALLILLDESRTIISRLNEIRPERHWAEHSMVSHLGLPVLTAILQVMFPDIYGVWNNTSDVGMKMVKLWDKRWEKMKAGDVYVEMNSFYLQLSDALKVDLWTLDALWWVMKPKKRNV